MKPMSRGTFRVNDSTGWSKGLTVTADGDAVIAHAGVAALRLTADRSGLTTALSRVLHRDGFTPGHDRGRVLTDTAVMMADGGNTVRGIDVLRHQRDLFGEVASPATVSRALAEVDQATLQRMDAARALVRARVWELIAARHGGVPPARVATGDLGETIVLRIDAHFIDVYSGKEHAGRLRGRYGLHPMAVMCDNTDECLADQLRADGLPGIPATLDAASGPHTVGQVAEITHLLPHLRHWAPGLRVFVRRVKPLRETTPKPLPGTGQLELDLQTRAAGWRYEAFATNAGPTQPDKNPHEVTAWLDGRHRVHARVEDHFRVGNDTGADRLPSQRFAVNAAWHRVQAIACDLIAWMRLLGCDNALARTEPATLQYRIFHTPATLTRGGRRRRLNFPPDWPWTGHIQAVFQRLFALPVPTRNPHHPPD